MVPSHLLIVMDRWQGLRGIHQVHFRRSLTAKTLITQFELGGGVVAVAVVVVDGGGEDVVVVVVVSPNVWPEEVVVSPPSPPGVDGCMGSLIRDSVIDDVETLPTNAPKVA
jgi:hypothetical protein